MPLHGIPCSTLMLSLANGPQAKHSHLQIEALKVCTPVEDIRDDSVEEGLGFTV